MSTDRIEKRVVLRAPRSRVCEVAGGTQLTVVESGFDGIPLARRAQAFEANEGGWAAQLENIGRHVSA